MRRSSSRLAIEPVFDGAGDRQATLAWCDQLRSMYRAWAAKRRMQITEIAGSGADKRPADPDGQRLWRPSHPVTGSRAPRLRAVRGRGGPGHRASASCRRAARRCTCREGAQTDRRGARTSAADQRRGATLSRRAAAGSRRRRQMAHRPARSRAAAENSICFRPASGRTRRRLAPTPCLYRADCANSGKRQIRKSEMRTEQPPHALHLGAGDDTHPARCE